MKSFTLLPVLWLLLAAPAHAELRLPRPPSANQHVVDLAGVISGDDQVKLQELGEKLQSEMDKHLVVVTIGSMREYGGAGMRVDDFAARLFRLWGIGHPERSGQDYNTGILLLVSVSDRQSRIELGAGWRHEKDSDSAHIMSNLLIPAFKDGDYSEGLVQGARALDRMARGLSVPTSRRLSSGKMLMLGAGGAVGLASVVSLFRSGTDGWGFNLWRAIFSVLWWMLRFLFSMLGSSRRHDHHYDTDGYRYGSRHHHHHHHDHHDSGVSWLGGLFSSGGGSSSSSYRGSSGGGSSSGGSRGGGASGSW